MTSQLQGFLGEMDYLDVNVWLWVETALVNLMDKVLWELDGGVCPC